jgi:hypothetical protein
MRSKWWQPRQHLVAYPLSNHNSGQRISAITLQSLASQRRSLARPQIVDQISEPSGCVQLLLTGRGCLLVQLHLGLPRARPRSAPPIVSAHAAPHSAIKSQKPYASSAEYRPLLTSQRKAASTRLQMMTRTAGLPRSGGGEHRRKGRLRSRLKALARAPEVQAKELRQLQRYERRWPPGTESCGNAVRKPLSAPGRS